MQIRRTWVFDGPNLWSRAPVLSACVDLQGLQDATSASLSGFNDRLAKWLPMLFDPQGQDRRRLEFRERIATGLDLAQVLNRVCVELQAIARGSELPYAEVRASSAPGIYYLAFQFEEEAVARACLIEARKLVSAAAQNRTYHAETAIQHLRDLANLICLGPSTNAIVSAARRRGIPVRRLDEGSLVQLGHGCHQHRIRMAVSDGTNAIGQDIAQDKEVTKSLLRSVGLPVPGGRSVESPDDAWHAAVEIGLPIVVKPRNANHGRGVAINLMTREQIAKAYEAALPEGDGVLIEKFVLGAEHRLLVVDGRMVAASRGEPEVVVGDGHSTVRTLVDELNRDPRRGDDWASPLSKIEIDSVAEMMLSKQGYTADSVVSADATVLIHYNGEFLTDVTAEVHPETAAVAVLAARVVGLNIAGIDVIARDIRQPLGPQGGKIIEVNAGPGLRMHFEPQFGTPQPVGEIIVESMFGPDQNGRMPIVAVTGSEGRTVVTRLLSHLLRGRWPNLGLADSQGLLVGDQPLENHDLSEAASSRALLLHPDTQAAVIEVSPLRMIQEGLGFDHCQVVLVINSVEGSDAGDEVLPIQQGDIERAIVASILPQSGTLVFNAQDPSATELAEEHSGNVILFSDRPDKRKSVGSKGDAEKAVFLRNSCIFLAVGDRETELVPLTQLSAIIQPADGFAVRNLLAAIAAAWSLGLSPDELRTRLASLASELT